MIILRKIFPINSYFYISVMSDIELPDYGVQTDLSMDIEKGIFLRKKNSNLTDNESNDSGNNSMNTNGSGTYQFVLYW